MGKNKYEIILNLDQWFKRCRLQKKLKVGLKWLTGVS